MIGQYWGTCTCSYIILLTTKITLRYYIADHFQWRLLKDNHGLNVLHEVPLIFVLQINSSLWWRAFISSVPTPSPKARIAKISHLDFCGNILRILSLTTRNDLISVTFTLNNLHCQDMHRLYEIAFLCTRS